MSVYLNLTAVINYLYPAASSADWSSQINADGSQSITKWNTAALGVIPTDAELTAAWPQVQLNLLQGPQIALIQQSYQAHIDNGFTSSALGTVHQYPSTFTDQFNLTACVVASMIPGQPSGWATLFWCGDSSTPPVWNYLSHTAAQIQQVGIDSMAYIMASKQHQALRIGQIKAATTAAAVQVIVW